VGLTPVVVPGVVLSEDLQADGNATDAIAVPTARMPALFRNCRLENFVTRKIDFFIGNSFLSFPAICPP
jgi:hypothetical protein